MNPDLLERLSLDRALGHLSPDVEALLDEVLAANPEAARQAGEYRETVRLAAITMPKLAAPVALPPRVVERFPYRSLGRWAAVAASFALGVGITLLMPGRPQPSPGRIAAPTASLVSVASPQRKDLPPEIERKARMLPFWSAQRASLLASASKSSIHE